jgi:hypothetical protein
MMEQISMFELLNPVESRFTYECRRGSGFENGRVRIYCASRHLDIMELAGFLKTEYGVGGHSSNFQDGGHGFADHNASGIMIREWKTNTTEKYNWQQVAKEVKRLIAMDDYLDQEDKQKIRQLENKFHGPVPINAIHPRFRIEVPA